MQSLVESVEADLPVRLSALQRSLMTYLSNDTTVSILFRPILVRTCLFVFLLVVVVVPILSVRDKLIWGIWLFCLH